MAQADARRKLPNRYFHLVFSALMGAAMVFIVTFFVTMANTGLGGDFAARWGKAFAIGYCVAVPVIYFLVPLVRGITARLVESPEGVQS
jgi:hypothetical protein